LRIRLQGVSRAVILKAQRQIEAYVRQLNLSLFMVEKHMKATPMPNLACGIIPWGSLVSKQRLTKRLLMTLPQGAGVSVRARHDRRGGDFAGFFTKLNAVETVDDIWRRAIAAKAANRVCRVTWPRE
jgi:hypothetical protein